MPNTRYWMSLVTDRGRPVDGIKRIRAKSIAICGVLALTLSSAAYSLDHSKPASPDDPIIPADKKLEFLLYAKHEHPRLSTIPERVEVGDTLPNSGVVYYAIPLHYGHPFLRWTQICRYTLVVDRSTSEVLQVLN